MRQLITFHELETCKTDWANDVVALVPTMGSLHAGHQALVEKAKQIADNVMLYIYVNPTQFAPHEDFETYPRPLDADLARCSEWGVDAVFMPTDAMIFPNGRDNTSLISPPEYLNNSQYASVRPHFFTGVCSVLTRMFILTQPNAAVFGLKDAQQFAIVKRLVQDLFLPIQIVGVPTVREASGLAMSSRNQYLTDDTKADALVLSQLLRWMQQHVQSGQRQTSKLLSEAETLFRSELSKHSAFELDFLDITHLETFSQPTLVSDHDHLIAGGRLNGVYLIDCLGLSEDVTFPVTPLFQRYGNTACV